MSAYEDLVAARALISSPEKWTKGVVTGRYCAMYAVACVIQSSGADQRWRDCEGALLKALPRSARLKYAFHIIAYNDADSTTHADILALFDKAIKVAS